MADYFDPAATLAPQDPLRDWASQNLDPITGALIATDPSKAIDQMISRGIAPPPHVMAYDDPAGGSNNGGALPVFDARGKMMGNQTSAQGQPAVPASSQPSLSPPMPVASPLDPASVPSGIPLPQARPAEAGPGASDISAQAKKPSVEDALSGFSKSLAGVKPIQPPPVNPVGTPSVRAAHASGAPNIQALLQMIGQQTSPSPLSTLGRLLVAGKA